MCVASSEVLVGNVEAKVIDVGAPTTGPPMRPVSRRKIVSCSASPMRHKATTMLRLRGCRAPRIGCVKPGAQPGGPAAMAEVRWFRMRSSRVSRTRSVSVLNRTQTPLRPNPAPTRAARRALTIAADIDDRVDSNGISASEGLRYTYMTGGSLVNAVTVGEHARSPVCAVTACTVFQRARARRPVNAVVPQRQGGARSRDRTCDLQFRKLPLYPTELCERARRTLVRRRRSVAGRLAVSRGRCSGISGEPAVQRLGSCGRDLTLHNIYYRRSAWNGHGAHARTRVLEPPRAPLVQHRRPL